MSVPYHAPAVPAVQSNSFALLVNAVPLLFLAVQFCCISLRSMPCRSRSSPSPAMPLLYTALLNFAVAGRCYALANPALLMAIWYQILTQTNQQIWLPTVRAIFCSCFHDHCLWAPIDNPPVLHDLHKRLPSGGFRVPHGTFSRVILSEEAFPYLSKKYSFPGYAPATRFRALPSLFCSLLCPC